jgi:hypothetical protein
MVIYQEQGVYFFFLKLFLSCRQTFEKQLFLFCATAKIPQLRYMYQVKASDAFLNEKRVAFLGFFRL